MRRIVIACICWALSSGCRKHEASASGEASAAPSITTATASAPSASAAPSASVMPAPTGSVPFGAPPDVRVAIPQAGATSLTGTVQVGQTFGVLFPPTDDWRDAWEIESCAMEQRKCPLGEPTTIITRGDEIGREELWKIAPDKVGTHVLKARYIKRVMRTDPGKPTKRVQITVTVTPAS